MRGPRTFAFAVALVAAQGCGKSDSERHADQAAGRVVDKQQDLRDVHRDMAAATADFQTRRETRYRGLVAQLQVIATQAPLVSAMADAFPLTEAGRADVTDKLQRLQMRLDEARNQVDLVRTSRVEDFKDIDDRATAAVKKLDDARTDAWDALDRAPRTDRSS